MIIVTALACCDDDDDDSKYDRLRLAIAGGVFFKSSPVFKKLPSSASSL